MSICPLDSQVKWLADELSDRLTTGMTNSQNAVTSHMRPNIEISHRLNGEVKDYAARHGMTAGDAYQRVIETGLEALEVQDDAPDWDRLSDEYGLDDDEREAVQAIYQIVAEHHPGWAQKQDIIQRAHEAHPAGKDSDWWWRTLVTECLVDAGVVEKRDGGLVRLAE